MSIIIMGSEKQREAPFFATIQFYYQKLGTI